MRYDAQLNIRIDSDELKKIKRRAKDKNMTVGEYIRYMVDKGERTDYDNQDNELSDW